MNFVANFIRYPALQFKGKKFENRLIFQKVKDS